MLGSGGRCRVEFVCPTGMEREDVDEGAQPPRQPDELVGIGVGSRSRPPIMTYSQVTRFRNACAALITASRSYFFSTGMIGSRWAEVGAWSEMASRNCSGRLANSSMPGRMPTVDTVMCRAPIPSPSGLLRIVSAVSTAGQLSSGSPIPMKTMLVGFSAGIAQNDLAHLSAISNGRQVSAEPHAARGAKGAAERASRLGRDAEGAPGAGRDEHRSR